MQLTVISTPRGKYFFWENVTTEYMMNRIVAPETCDSEQLIVMRNGREIDRGVIVFALSHSATQFTGLSRHGPVGVLYARDFEEGDILHIVPNQSREPTEHFETFYLHALMNCVGRPEWKPYKKARKMIAA
jgi:hypothetical protein